MPRARGLRGIAALALALAPPAHAQLLEDPSLTLELVTSGLAAPTSMGFVGPDDILVLEKDTARVRRVTGGVLNPTPVMTLPANVDGERGALGLAVDTATPPHVFIYFTEAASYGAPAIANRVYRYDWNPVSGTLTDPQLVLDLPVFPGSTHNGGVIQLGPPGEVPGVGDGSLLYAVIGDLNRNGQLQNNSAGAAPDDSSVILRVQQDGTPAPGNPFAPYCSVTTTTACTTAADCPGGELCRTQVARYYGYGVRNSFGLALDPVTGALWDTENGPTNYDEVNRVAPGFNSGWNPLMGPDDRDPQGVGNLFNMPGAGLTYSDPEFSWLAPIAPTALVFPVGSSLGPAYDHTVILGEVRFHQLYALPLNATRTGFDLAGVTGLEDGVADSASERDAFRIGTSFATTDLEIGPDGHLYVVRISPGSIYRIRGPGPAGVPALPAWAVAALVLLLGTGGVLYARARGGRPSR